MSLLSSGGRPRHLRLTRRICAPACGARGTGSRTTIRLCANSPRSPRPDVEALPLEAFPASFQADLKAYLDRRLHADPFDDVPQRSVRPITANTDRQALARAASLIARESGTECICSIGDLVQPERVKNLLLHFYRRSGGRWGKPANDMIHKLILAARIHVRVDDEWMKQLERLRRPIVAALAEQSRTAGFVDPLARTDGAIRQ